MACMIGQRKKVWFCLMAMTVLLASAVVTFAGKPLVAFAQSPSISTISDLTVPANGWGFPAPWGTAFDSSGHVWVALPGCDPGPRCSSTFPGMIGKLKIASAVPGTNRGVTEYSYQHLCASCGTHTSGIAIDANGNIWFTDAIQSMLGSFNTSSSAFSLFKTPSSASHPHDGLNAGPNRTVWFTEEFADKLGRVVLR